MGAAAECLPAPDRHLPQRSEAHGVMTDKTPSTKTLNGICVPGLCAPRRSQPYGGRQCRALNTMP